MYLSKIELDVSRKRTQEAMISRNKLHGAIEESLMSSEGVRNRNLWRIDKVDGKTYLLVLSKEKPRVHIITEQFGTQDGKYEMKEYDALLERIKNDTMWQFRLVANPTVCKKDGEGRRKRVAHIAPAFQMKWLENQAEKYGFKIMPDMTNIMESRWLMFNRRGNRMIRALSVTYEGVLVVRDFEKFKEALINGIGREKAYGMGLLTIMRVMK